MKSFSTPTSRIALRSYCVMLASRQFTFVITIFSTQPTQMILEFARQHAFVLISEDTDFGELLAPAMHSHPLIRAVTHLRTHDPGRASRSFAGEPSPTARRSDPRGHRGHRAEPASSSTPTTDASNTRTAGAVGVCASRVAAGRGPKPADTNQRRPWIDSDRIVAGALLDRPVSSLTNGQ